MEITRIENDKQKMIMMSLIVSEKFCKEIIPILDIDYQLVSQTFTGFYRTVLDWISEYYKKYKTSPGKDIKQIFETKTSTDKFEANERELIGQFIANLNDKFVREKNFNEDYVLDQARNYLRIANLELLQLRIDEAKANGNIDLAEALINSFKKIEKETSNINLVDVFQDVDRVIEILSEEDEYIFKWPGYLNRFIGGLSRGSFVCVTGPGKRGKSWWLKEIALTALFQGLRVAIFNLEMTEKEYLKRIAQNVCGEVSSKKNKEKLVQVPYFVPGENGIENINYREYKKTGIDTVKVRKKLVELRSMIRAGQLKIFSCPTDSLTVPGLKSELDKQVISGFSPDIIVVDFADILADTEKNEYRHAIDKKWKQLRGLALSSHSIVVTGSHSNSGTFKKNVGQADVSEDYRKVNHVTHMIGLNQTPVEKRAGVMRINVLANRTKYFNVEDYAVVLQNLHIGKCIIDSRAQKGIDLKACLALFQNEDWG